MKSAVSGAIQGPPEDLLTGAKSAAYPHDSSDECAHLFTGKREKCSDVDTWAYPPKAIRDVPFGHSLATLKADWQTVFKIRCAKLPLRAHFPMENHFSRNAFRKHSSKAKTSLPICGLSSPAFGSDRGNGSMAGERVQGFNHPGQADVLSPLDPTATASGI